MGEHAQYVELTHPSTPPNLDIYVYLAYKLDSFHMDSFPQPPSPCSIDPPNCIVLCSSILDSTCVVNEDQVVYGVGAVYPTCIIILDECVRESK